MWRALWFGWLSVLAVAPMACGADPLLVLEATGPALARVVTADGGRPADPGARTRRLQALLHQRLPFTRNLRVEEAALSVMPGAAVGRLVSYAGVGRSDLVQSLRERDDRLFLGARYRGARGDVTLEVDDRSDGVGVALVLRYRY